jgi:hypothetical protein
MKLGITSSGLFLIERRVNEVGDLNINTPRQTLFRLGQIERK